MTARAARFRPSRRAFTLVEVMVAGLITVFVLGAVTMSLARLGDVKNTCRTRLETFLRADAALSTMRRDVASVVRADDLFYCRLLITDDIVDTPAGQMARDELLLFNTRLRPMRDIDWNGEGIEYESQFRIQDDDLGPALWARRDALPDKYITAGGMASPLVDGIVGLSIEAYDGEQWFEDWDSDEDGLPLAVSIMITAAAPNAEGDLYAGPLATLRTVVAIDRVLQPRDHFEAEHELFLEEEALRIAEERAANAANAGDTGDESAGGLPVDPEGRPLPPGGIPGRGAGLGGGGLGGPEGGGSGPRGSFGSSGGGGQGGGGRRPPSNTGVGNTRPQPGDIPPE